MKFIANWLCNWSGFAFIHFPSFVMVNDGPPSWWCHSLSFMIYFVWSRTNLWKRNHLSYCSYNTCNCSLTFFGLMQEIINEALEKLPVMKELMDMYCGPDRVTAKEQQEELERVAKTLPENIPSSVKRFTDRALLSLQVCCPHHFYLLDCFFLFCSIYFRM